MKTKSDPLHKHRQRRLRAIAYGMDLIIIIILLGSSMKCLVNGNGMFTIELKVMNSTCDGESCDGYEFKICYAENGYLTLSFYISTTKLYTIAMLDLRTEQLWFWRFSQIEVTKPPIVTVPDSMIGSIGGNLTIPCNVSELYSDTVIRWLKHHRSISTTINIRESERFFGGTNKSPDLTIISVQKEDEGNYICQAQNLEFDGSSLPVYLSILENPVVNVPNIEPAIEGTNITIPCNVSPTSEVTKISWYKNNSTLDIYGNDRFSGGTISAPSLKIFFVEENDEGNYTCQAMNPVGIGKSVPIHMQVLPDKPKVHLQRIEPVVIGSNITVRCYISSVSTLMSVTLVNNNVTIYTSNASKLRKIFGNESKMYVSLTICLVKKEHEGTVICRAHNTAGYDGYSQPFQLIVHEGKLEYYYICNNCFEKKKSLFNQKL
ncbi:Hypothetical predicted protein [Mytilus galloprovincialis]|uniref:Ig-like domain-containing protein n=1 Tax=Mytilus galloprovincialis TaxID=29158 RepID=A0A8B6EH92_MYTGA|nr:Hypothetical predicted protein [Mytilus galloprovincialis]